MNLDEISTLGRVASPAEMIDAIHERTLQSAKGYNEKSSELLGNLIEVEKNKVFLKKGYSSLFRYCLDALKLSENMADQFIAVARKSIEVPKMKELIDEGRMHLTNARKIAKVIRPETEVLWLEKAQTLSSRALERELFRLEPDKVKKETLRPISQSLTRLTIDISEEVESNLRRIQDLESQRQKRAVSLVEVLTTLSQNHLRKHDPLKKAERNKYKLVPLAPKVGESTQHLGLSSQVGQSSKKSVASPPTVGQARALSSQLRRPMPQSLIHQVNLRDQGQCTHLGPNGQRCTSTRWLDRHHRILLSQGGTHTLANVQTLCSAHHQFLHCSSQSHTRNLSHKPLQQM